MQEKLTLCEVVYLSVCIWGLVWQWLCMMVYLISLVFLIIIFYSKCMKTMAHTESTDGIQCKIYDKIIMITNP